MPLGEGIQLGAIDLLALSLYAVYEGLHPLHAFVRDELYEFPLKRRRTEGGDIWQKAAEVIQRCDGWAVTLYDCVKDGRKRSVIP